MTETDIADAARLFGEKVSVSRRTDVTLGGIADEITVTEAVRHAFIAGARLAVQQERDDIAAFLERDWQQVLVSPRMVLVRKIRDGSY